MRKKVIISIFSQLFVDNKGDVPLEFLTDGLYEKIGDGFEITYDESELTGFGKTQTTLRVGDKQIMLKRTGECTSQFMWEEGKKHVSLYESEDVSFTVAMTAHRIKSTLSQDGGRVEIDYSIDMNGERAGTNRFRMDVRPADEPSPSPGLFNLHC